MRFGKPRTHQIHNKGGREQKKRKKGGGILRVLKWVGEVVQWFRVLAAPAEDLSLGLSTHIGWLAHNNLPM